MSARNGKKKAIAKKRGAKKAAAKKAAPRNRLDDARKVLEDQQREQAERIEACQDAVQRVLESHGCGLFAALVIQDDQTIRAVPRVGIVEESMT